MGEFEKKLKSKFKDFTPVPPMGVFENSLKESDHPKGPYAFNHHYLLALLATALISILSYNAYHDSSRKSVLTSKLESRKAGLSINKGNTINEIGKHKSSNYEPKQVLTTRSTKGISDKPINDPHKPEIKTHLVQEEYRNYIVRERATGEIGIRHLSKASSVVIEEYAQGQFVDSESKKIELIPSLINPPILLEEKMVEFIPENTIQSPRKRITEPQPTIEISYSHLISEICYSNSGRISHLGLRYRQPIFRHISLYAGLSFFHHNYTIDYDVSLKERFRHKNKFPEMYRFNDDVVKIESSYNQISFPIGASISTSISSNLGIEIGVGYLVSMQMSHKFDYFTSDDAQNFGVTSSTSDFNTGLINLEVDAIYSLRRLKIRLGLVGLRSLANLGDDRLPLDGYGLSLGLGYDIR